MAKGQLQMALFPADAFIKVSAQQESFPATIIAIVDETRGATRWYIQIAISEYRLVESARTQGLCWFPIHPAKHWPESSCMTLISESLAMKPFSAVSSPTEVIERYRKATPASDEVFITWEPYVSQLLVNDQLHVLVDSSRFTGYIVDCLVVSRDFLLKNPSTVETFLECYFRALYEYDNREALVRLVLDDVKKTKVELTREQAVRLVEGIEWKNTQENFAHMGLRAGTLVHVEDMLGRIIDVLVSTGGIDRDPTGANSTVCSSTRRWRVCRRAISILVFRTNKSAVNWSYPRSPMRNGSHWFRSER